MKMGICRLCLRNSSEMSPLFETFIGEQLLIEIITSILGVELDNSMVFPRQICQDCLKNVNLLHDFYKKLIETQSSLSKWRMKNEAIVDRKNTYENDDGNNQIAFAETNPTDEDENSCMVTINRNVLSESIQERVEQYPIDIKIEPSDDDEKGHSCKEGNVKLSLRKKKQSNLLKCFICGPIFECDDKFNVHLLKHKEMLPYECSHCTTATHPIMLSNVNALNKHFESHSFKYVCPECPLRYRWRSSRDYHAKNFHDKSTVATNVRNNTNA
ncbi:zinc finger protein 331-like isoform X2 [Toxorhynchites rutilus septentrionalis]|uniref:zinc finger protein 331-like isoform X2 n=1 Tax=Toxorhynchites rutilus septentrionalis TaxID=329112 RepID=UPI0024798806|nr:zinc finger protein 331-like isoform X2 [Toxorhynchites rutilus septentrionalis]